MMKRLFALVVALAVVSAPVALEICQVTCESKAMPHDAESHAAHHHMPADHSGTSQQVSRVNGLCDHGTESTPSLVAARNSDTAASLLVAIPSIESIRLVPTRDVVYVRDSAWSDRLEVPRAIPLRL